MAHMGERRGAYRNFVRRSDRNKLLGRPGIDGRIILNWFLRKWNGEAWTGLIRLSICIGDGFLRMTLYFLMKCTLLVILLDLKKKSLKFSKA